MAQGDHPKEGSMFEQPQLLPSNKMKHTFKEWTTASGILEKIYCFHKNSRLKIYPIKITFSQRLHYPEKKLMLNQEAAVSKVSIAGANDYNCPSKNLQHFLDNYN